MISNESLHKLKEYQSQHPHFCNHYLFKSFIQKPENKKILIKTILNPNKENKKKLDEAFKRHHFRLKFLSYLSKTLYFNSIQFDKKKREENKRNLLILDAPISDKDNSLLIDQIASNEPEIENTLLTNSSLEEHLSNQKLLQCFKNLTQYQKEILTLYYVNSYTDTQIAKMQNKTQQTISKTRKKALLKLRRQIKGVM